MRLNPSLKMNFNLLLEDETHLKRCYRDPAKYLFKYHNIINDLLPFKFAGQKGLFLK